MSKYGQAVGKIELNVGGYDKELTPKVGDGRRFVKILSQAESNKDIMFDKFTDFIIDFIAREDPPANEEEKKELNLYVDRNLLPLLNRCMVAFGLTTEEELNAAKKEQLQAIGTSKKV